MEIGESQELESFDDKCQTGDECPKSGRWICKDHPYIEEVISKGQTFPNCRKGAGRHKGGGHRATWWYLV